MTLPTQTVSLTASPTATETVTSTFTLSATVTYSLTDTFSLSVTFSESLTETVSLTETFSESLTETRSLSFTDTLTHTFSLIRFDNYTTEKSPLQEVEGQEVRLMLKTIVNGEQKSLFNVSNNNNYEEELELRVYKHETLLGHDCTKYVARDQSIYFPLYETRKFGLEDTSYIEGEAFAEKAFVTFSAPHSFLKWIVCFKHKPVVFESEFIVGKWLLFTDSGYADPTDRYIHHKHIFQSHPSHTWFELMEPSANQYAAIRVMKTDISWNFTLAGSACQRFPQDHAECSLGDSLKIVRRNAPCTDEPGTYHDAPTGPSAHIYPGSAVVDHTGAWLPPAYPTLTSSATSGGIALFGTPDKHPLVEVFNTTETAHYVLAFVKLPADAGEYDVCFSARQQRAAWKQSGSNTTLSSFPMWRKLWHCPGGCPERAPRSQFWNLHLELSTLPTFRVDIERFSWSIKDLTEHSYGSIRVSGAGLSRATNNFTEESYWYSPGGDQLRLVEVASATETAATPASLGCWDWVRQQYQDEEALYPSASRDLNGPPGSFATNEKAGVTTAYTSIYTGRRYLSRYVCYKKGSDGAGWRVLPWDTSGEWSDLPMRYLFAHTADRVAINFTEPKPYPLIPGPHFTETPTQVTYSMNDTRAGTWGPIFVHFQNFTGRSPFVNPIVRIVLATKPCEYTRLYLWDDGEESKNVTKLPDTYAVRPEGVPAYGDPLYIRIPATPGLYRVCFRSSNWNWLASPDLFEVTTPPAIAIEVLDNRERVDTVAMVNDGDFYLSTLDTLKLVRPNTDCLGPSVLHTSVAYEYCEAADNAFCGSQTDAVVIDETPSIFRRLSQTNAAPQHYRKKIAFYITTPKAGQYMLCFRQNFTSNWIIGNSTWLGVKYVPPIVTPAPEETGRSDLRGGLVKEFLVERYQRTANEFSAKLVKCDHPAPCIQSPVGTEASQYGSSTIDSLDHGDRLLFNVTIPDAAGCHYLCYLIDPYTWHRLGPYTVFKNNMWWSGASSPYNTQTIELKITSLNFPLDTKPFALGGDKASLQLQQLPCSEKGQVVGMDLGLGDGQVSTATLIATLPSPKDNSRIVYKVCMFTSLPELNNEKNWLELPSLTGHVLATLPVAISNWFLDPILRYNNHPTQTHSGISTVYNTTADSTTVGFSFSLHSPIIGGEVKLVQYSASGCLTSGVPGISPRISDQYVIFQMPLDPGQYVVCYKDVSGGGWFAVRGENRTEFITVVAAAHPSYLKLSESKVMLSHLTTIGVTVAPTSCDMVGAADWLPTIAQDTWASSNLKLPPDNRNTFGRYIVCVLMKDGTRYHAMNVGNDVEGGGSGYFQQGLVAEALSVQLENPQFVPAFNRFSIFNESVFKAFPSTPSVSSISSFRSYSEISVDKRLRIQATLQRLGVTVPYGTGKVWIVPCPVPGSKQDLYCENDASFDKDPPYLLEGETCQKLQLGTAVFDVSLVSGCANEYGCGMKIRAKLQNFVFTSQPVWTNVATHQTDEIKIQPSFLCLSGRACTLRMTSSYLGVHEGAPTGRVELSYAYNTSSLKSGVPGAGVINWQQGGVIRIDFVPVLDPQVLELQVGILAKIEGNNLEFPSSLVIKTVFAQQIEILDLIPKDTVTKALRANRIPADSWQPEAGGYVEANLPYILIFSVKDPDGLLMEDLSNYNCHIELHTNAAGNSLLDASHDSITLFPQDLTVKRLSTPALLQGWSHPTVFSLKFRVLNNLGCGRWNPCVLNVTLSPKKSASIPTVHAGVTVSIRVPATTIEVSTTSTRVELGTGIDVFAVPGVPSVDGFLVDEFHSGDIYAWLFGPKPVNNGAVRGGATLTKESGGQSPRLHSDGRWGSQWVLRTTQPCVHCEVTFHSTAGAGPDPGETFSGTKYGMLNITFLSDAVDVNCPDTIELPYYEANTALLDINVTAVNAFLRLSAWPLWKVRLVPILNPNFKIFGNLNQVMDKGLAQFQSLYFVGKFEPDYVVKMQFETTSEVYDPLQEGSVLSHTKAMVCNVSLTLKKQQNPLQQVRRLVLPETQCDSNACHVMSSTSTFLTIGFPLHVERLASSGWVPDTGDYNLTIGVESDLRPRLVESWTCLQDTQTCISAPLTVPSIHKNITMESEDGVNVTLSHGSPTLRFASRMEQGGDGNVLIRRGKGEVTVMLSGKGVSLSPVREAAFSVCMLAPGSAVEENQMFHVLIACQKILFTLQSHSVPSYAIQLFQKTRLPAVLLPGVGSECGPEATELKFSIYLVYRFNNGPLLIESGAKNITRFEVTTTARQVLVDAADKKHSGLSLSFPQGDQEPGVHVGFYGLDELSTAVSVSAPGIPGTATKTKFVWKMSNATGDRVVLSSPTSDDACFTRSTRKKLRNSYLYTATNAGRGWELSKGVVVGVPFPLQIRVVTANGDRAYSQPNSLVKIELKTGTTCTDQSARRIQVNNENGVLVQKDARTRFGQVTVWVTLFNPCTNCVLTATLCFYGASLGECLSQPTLEPPSMSKRSASTAEFSTLVQTPPIQAGIEYQKLPAHTHNTGTAIQVLVSPVVVLPGGWTQHPPGLKEGDFRPQMTSSWQDTSPGALRYGNGGFLHPGTSVCGIPETPQYPSRFVAGTQHPNGSVFFEVSYLRPCSACTLYVTYLNSKFAIRENGGGAVVSFRVSTCSQGWLMKTVKSTTQVRNPFTVSLIRVDAGHVPTWSGNVPANLSVTERSGNGFGGNIAIEARSGDVSHAINGIATIRLTFSRACWYCRVSAGYLGADISVTSKPAKYVVTSAALPSTLHTTTSETTTLLYNGYLADDSGDKAVVAGGPSILNFQSDYLRHYVKPSFVTLAPVVSNVSSAIRQTAEGLVSLSVSRDGALVELASGFDVIDGSPSGALMITVSKGPISKYTPSLQFEGQPLGIEMIDGAALQKFDWLTEASIMLVGDGNAVTVLSGETRTVVVSFAGKTDFVHTPQRYFTSVAEQKEMFLKVTYDCSRCVNCIVQGETNLTLNTRGQANLTFTVSVGGGSCLMEVVPPADYPRTPASAFAPSSIELIVVLPAITNWYWESSDNFHILGGRRSSVGARVIAHTMRHLLLRGWSQGRMVFSNPYFDKDALNVQFTTYPPGCFVVMQKSLSGYNFNITGHFLPGPCLISALSGLPSGTKGTQSLDVESANVETVRVKPQIGHKGDMYNVSHMDVPLGNGKVGVATGRAVELTVFAMNADGVVAEGDFATEVRWVISREVTKLGKITRSWLNTTTTVRNGVATMTVTPEDDTREVECCTQQQTSPACTLCPTCCSINPTSAHTPWLMQLLAIKDNVVVADVFLGELHVVSWPKKVQVNVLQQNTWTDITTGSYNVLVGYMISLALVLTDTKGVLPDYNGENAVTHATLQPNEEPCSQEGWPGSESCTTFALDTACVDRLPPPCATSWTTLNNANSSLRVRIVNGVSFIHNLSIVRGGLQRFLVTTDWGELLHSDMLFVKSVSHFTVQVSKVVSSPCVGNMGLQDVNSFGCPLPEQFFDAKHLRDGKSSLSSLTMELKRLTPGAGFDLSIAVVGSDAKILASLSPDAYMQVRAKCEASPLAFAFHAPHSPGNVVDGHIAKVVDGVATWQNISMTGYCAVTLLTVTCVNPNNSLDTFHGKYMSFNTFELGSPTLLSSAPPPTPAPTPSPPEAFVFPTAQLRLTGTDVTVVKGIFKQAWEADFVERLGIVVEVLLDWICVVPKGEVVPAPTLATTGAAVVTPMPTVDLTAPLIATNLKRDSAACELLASDGAVKRPAHREGDALVSVAECTLSALRCDIALEFRVKGELTKMDLNRVVQGVVTTESNFRKLVSSKGTLMTIDVYVPGITGVEGMNETYANETATPDESFDLPPIEASSSPSLHQLLGMAFLGCVASVVL